jgi:heme/copper-type cytochrome/quinol oxidase subunit 4
MKINNKISKWAAKNVILSVGIIIVLEFFKIFLGIKVGKGLFASISSNDFLILCILMFSLVFTLQKRYKRLYSQLSTKDAYAGLIKYNTAIFLSSFILSISLGAHLNSLEHPTRNIHLSASEHQANSDSTKHALLKQALEKQQNGPSIAEQKPSDTGRRVVYFLLFLLSLVLTYIAAVFACSIACSGYGVAAILVILLAQGVLGSGIYFLLKVFRRGFIKKWKETSHEQKKREKKKYWLTLLISTLAFWLFILLANLLE